MMRWSNPIWTILLLLGCSPCFADEPQVLPPVVDILTKDEFGGHVLSKEEDCTVNGISRGRNPSCSWTSGIEAINVFMRRSPLFGNYDFPSFIHLENVSPKSNFDGHLLSDQETAIVGESNLSSGSAGTADGRFINGASTLTSPDADVTTLLHMTVESNFGQPATEDMPSFNEWAKKRLEEQNLPSGQSGGGIINKIITAKKSRHKNYASVDCGAKVLTANSESQSASAVLSHDQDDYMLNPCTAKAWLVLELCEAVQLERLELANFELFSSSPRHFNVHSSDRYPTRDWNFIGTFEAMDEKTAQSFPLHQSSFSKYIKLEMVSHYGDEHFCPLSLIRVYGTSEYEALDTEEQTPDEQNLSPSIIVAHSSVSTNGESITDESIHSAIASDSKNLFGSAKDAVLTIVKKAAEVLSPRNISEHLIGRKELDGLTDEIAGKNCQCLKRIEDLNCELEAAGCNNSLTKQSLSHLMCNYDKLNSLVQRLTFRKGNFSRMCATGCSEYVCSHPAKCKTNPKICEFYFAVLGSLRFGALCYLDKLIRLVSPIGKIPSELSAKSFSDISKTPISTREKIVTHLSAGHEGQASVTSPIYISNVVDSPSATSMEMDISNGMVVTAKTTVISTTNIDFGVTNSYRQIKPTPSDVEDSRERTLSSVSQRIESSSIPGIVTSISFDESHGFLDTSKEDSSKPVFKFDDKLSNATVSGSSTSINSNSIESVSLLEDTKLQSEPHEVQSSSIVINIAESTNIDVGYTEDPEVLAIPVPVSSSFPQPTASNGTDGKPNVLTGGIVGSLLTPGQKESVFVRLSNRIKALELNMSLSGQYLEELSRRYRKQMEEMQRAFNKTISALNETARMAHERDIKQQEVIGMLQMQLDTLTKVVSSMAEQQEGLHSQVIARHLVIIMVEVVVMMALFFTCFRPGLHQSHLQSFSSAVVARVSSGRSRSIEKESKATPVRALAGRPPDRRNSDPNLAGLSPRTLLRDRRRPSSEALNVSGTYSDLLIVEPTIPIWVDRPVDSKDKEINLSKKQKRRKCRNKGSHGSDQLYRSVSNDALAMKPPVHPRIARKISAVEASCAERFFDNPLESGRQKVIRNNDDSVFNDKYTHRKTSSLDRKKNATAVIQLERPSPPAQLQRENVIRATDDQRTGSSNCLLNLPLSCNQPFSFKETSLTASSLVYCNGNRR